MNQKNSAACDAAEAASREVCRFKSDAEDILSEVNVPAQASMPDIVAQLALKLVSPPAGTDAPAHVPASNTSGVADQAQASAWMEPSVMDWFWP